jgi:DNA-binding XRE family transcriptional regulator
MSVLSDMSTLRRLYRFLTQRRLALGLSQTELAQLMGTKQSSVSEFEREQSMPRMPTLIRWAKALLSWFRLIHYNAAGQVLGVYDFGRPDNAPVSRRPLAWAKCEYSWSLPTRVVAVEPEEEAYLGRLRHRLQAAA